MGLKRVELEKANIGMGCLGRARDDEPVFILRAQDRLAPLVVAQWAAMARLFGVGEAKVREVEALAEAMRGWGKENGSKLPD